MDIVILCKNLKLKIMKTVAQIFSPRPAHFVGDGFRVHNFIPSYAALNQRRMDPFLILDYNATYHFPPSEIPKGVGVHPHKGFETVTLAYKGRIEHGDSAGGGGVIKEGDIQWMTAGAGVLHKEFHETQWSKSGGDFQMIQLWVNLPAKDKNTPPKYQSLTQGDLGKYELEDGKGTLEVIAGNYNGVTGSASTFTPIEMYNFRAKKGGTIQLNIPKEYTTFLLVLEGSATINQRDEVAQDHLALMNLDGEEFTITAHEDSVIFIAGGKPIGEPIVHYGPFVMNTEAEINKAIEEYNQGLFGQL